jgi:hypothetical protein
LIIYHYTFVYTYWINRPYEFSHFFANNKLIKYNVLDKEKVMKGYKLAYFNYLMICQGNNFHGHNPDFTFSPRYKMILYTNDPTLIPSNDFNMMEHLMKDGGRKMEEEIEEIEDEETKKIIEESRKMMDPWNSINVVHFNKFDSNLDIDLKSIVQPLAWLLLNNPIILNGDDTFIHDNIYYYFFIKVLIV